MIDVTREQDIERLRQAASLLQFENDRLHRRLRELIDTDDERLQLELEGLREQLAKQNRALFGTSSEKRRSDDNGSNRRKPPADRQGHGPTEQTELPIVEDVHDLDEADKVCPSCGGCLAEMAGQFEESDEVDVVERSFRIVRHKRKKYRCGCGSVIETAPGPPRLISGGRYSIGFACAIAVAKYLDHMPLARQVRQMSRHGLVVTTPTLWDQLFALAEHLRPTYDALHGYVLAAPVVGADETTWRLMDKRGSKTHWAWSVTREDAVYYRIDASRSAETASKILENYEGTVVCDGYSAYGALRKQRQASRDGPESFRLAHCWAHARRKFVEAEPHYPQVGEVLDLIGELYAIEHRAAETANGDLHGRRAALRQEHSREVVTKIHKWMLEQRALPKSAIGRAIAYTDGVWPGLNRFLDDARVPLDNNRSERTMRGVALGRKNHYGSRSLRGTKVAAVFYSLIESAKLAGAEPSAYLREAAHSAILNPGSVTLPHDLISN